MSITVEISQETFNRLLASARQAGKENVAELLDEWSKPSSNGSEDKLSARKEAVRKVREFRLRMKEKYGIMPDSTPLIREDRDR